jgi:hypothetical protein
VDELKGQTSGIASEELCLHHKAHAAVIYLWAMSAGHSNPESKWIWNINGAPEDIKELVYYLNKEVLGADPLQPSQQYVHEYFPTVRDRLECRQWLAKLFVDMNLDMNILERAFPLTTT